MIDWLKLSIPLTGIAVTETQDGTTLLNYELLSILGFKVQSSNCEFSISGDWQPAALSCPYESIPSSFSGIAIKLWSGNTLCNSYLEMKCSPAKILQGHNVYGTTDIQVCAEEMIRALCHAFNGVLDYLDLAKMTLDIIDVTYSARLPDERTSLAFIRFLKNVSSGQMRRSVNSDDYETTCYLTPKNSKKRVLKVYLKYPELMAERAKLEAVLVKQPRNEEVLKRLNVNNNQLQEFAKNLARFEARLKKDWFKRRNYPRLLTDWIKMQRDYESEGRCLIKELWNAAFGDLLEALKGEGIAMASHDKIHNKLRDEFKRETKKGFSYSKADRLYGFYMRLVNEGYNAVYSSHDRATFSRYLKDLIQGSGLSKAQLQNLEQSSGSNIIPFCKLVEINFDQQRPHYYSEPQSGFRPINNTITPLRVANF